MIQLTIKLASIYDAKANGIQARTQRGDMGECSPVRISKKFN